MWLLKWMSIFGERLKIGLRLPVISQQQLTKF